MNLDDLDQIPTLGPALPPKTPALPEWQQVRGAVKGLERNRITGKYRNVDPTVVLLWPF